MAMVLDPSEAAEYYFTYINQVPTDDICGVLERQAGETAALLGSISDEGSLRRYAPDKWSIREVVSHINDAERIFTSRALWFARGFPDPLPGFDQNLAIGSAAADDRPWPTHIEELEAIRAATVSLFRNLPADSWTRRGVASGHPVSVRAMAYITAGHLAHHVRLLRERYL